MKLRKPPGAAIRHTRRHLQYPAQDVSAPNLLPSISPHADLFPDIVGVLSHSGQISMLEDGEGRWK
jgi:hypothetical protein